MSPNNPYLKIFRTMCKEEIDLYSPEFLSAAIDRKKPEKTLFEIVKGCSEADEFWNALDDRKKMEIASEYSLGLSFCYSLRMALVRKFSWSVPDDFSLDLIASLKMPIVEIGAGTGYWGWIFRQMGIECHLYDKKPGVNHYVNHLWTEITTGDESCAANHPNSALFLCWPVYEDPMAFNALSQYRGDTVIYVGEPASGCCGDDNFFALLNEKFIEESFDRKISYYGIHDRIVIYRRKS